MSATEACAQLVDAFADTQTGYNACIKDPAGVFRNRIKFCISGSADFN
jgi:hypothetical protein